MSADTQDMINQLQMQLATPPQPSLFGLTAPPDPSGLRALLQKLQAQQAVNQTGGTPGQYGYLHDAGQKAFAQVGQGLGAAIGGALNPPPTAAAQAATPQAQISSAIQSAQRNYQTLIGQGVAENTARTAVAKQMVSAGVPGAADVLAKSGQQGLEDLFKGAETAKDTSQAAMDTASIAQKAREEKGASWTDVGQNSDYKFQRNGLGEFRSVKIAEKNPPLTADQSTNADAIAKKIANYDMQMSTAVGRGNVQQRQEMLGRVLAVNPDFDEKNFKQSTDALKAYGPSGVQGQLVLKTQNAMNHLAALDQWGKALKNGDSQTANKIGNFFASEFNNPALSTYDTAAPTVANEVSGAIIKGGGSAAERLERVKKYADTKNDASRAAALNADRSLLGAQYKNNQNLYEKTTLRKDFGDRFPVEGGFPPPPGTAAASPASGWGKATVVSQ